MSAVELEVQTASGPYPILIGPGVRREIPRLLAQLTRASRLYLVTDSNLELLHAESLQGILGEMRVPVARIVVPAGEPSKSPAELARLWREMIRAGCDRNSCVVALGGGVVGDLAGFAAASVLRGIQFVQVPTTVLAMVDASVGGKTGIDLPEGKNLVGAFHQPRAVIMDLDFLQTLPEREARAGWAEVVKAAAIRDVELFERLERERDGLLGRSPDVLSGVIQAAVRIKADVVEGDERESGLRRILNFGHTLAHGLEATTGYTDWLHGEAVAVGMVFAAQLGEALGTTAGGTRERLRTCLRAYGLPVAPGRADPGQVTTAMDYDKKRGPEGIHWVLLEAVGQATVTSAVPRELVRRELESFLASS